MAIQHTVRSVWLGITDDLHEGFWKWDDSGAPTTTTAVPAGLVNWALHEPNNWDNEDHGTLYVERGSRTGLWNDMGAGS